MTDAGFLFNNAELAFAAYSNLQFGSTNSPVNIEALQVPRGFGMSATQATEFVKRYPTVVTQFNDTANEGGMGTSFSATVFKDTTGKLTLAIRGTAELTGTPNDIVPTDRDILLQGAGYDQIVAMVNWWARVSAPAGQMVNQFRLLDAPPNLVPAGAVELRASTELAMPGRSSCWTSHRKL